MKVLALLLSTIALASAQGQLYCNRDTAGNGECEKITPPRHTFCCIRGSSSFGEYTHKKVSTTIGNDPNGSSFCGKPIPEEGPDIKEGTIYCAH
ncbi:Ecp9-6 [Fulvia fulva]|uniref:Ecp9-6 n=1 Tax=Passalora fulva TaxID=5499 RepID=A0A1P8YXQ0_PASFU|nr:Ecp9-6 [Fulvia fulva]AQA29289.1 extracellular protein 9-6 [Fulvia fulva]KAK4621763.1 Ecp9-6 [Fulvia fulva]KAK4623099.1 Ecp9-6 [Fulvia fulva]UJO18411.1 Ecp9-6 [Fulvia fulva]WPV16023.1 Ecp9-6 [Fulvia fulva]